MTDGMPHIYRVMTELLPAGELVCVCCDGVQRHSEVTGFDEDLAGYVCWRCFGHLAQAEWWLTGAPRACRCRRPEQMEALDLDLVEMVDREPGGSGGALGDL